MANDKNGFITGHYFDYCEYCVHDGKCELKHFEFMGVAPGEKKVDDTPYPGHEDLAHHFTVFQQGVPRSACGGRIHTTDSFYFPLQCECGTVISSLMLQLLGRGMCAKFNPDTPKGRARKRAAIKIAKRKRITLAEIDPADLPPGDPNYKPVMRH